jgi:cytosine/adenosine deaminase-related metal-dependent hydrolase
MSRRSGQRGAQRRTQAPRRANPVEFWHAPQQLPDVELIFVPDDVGALARSLGDPPMHHGTTAGHYFNAVIERTSALARALSLSADLLGDPLDS